jgi:hypothetical protein
VAGVVLVVVVVDFVASGPGVTLDVVVVDFVASEPGVVLVVATVVDLVSSTAALRVSSIIAAISIATNIFFISNLLNLVIAMLQVRRPRALSIIVLGQDDTNAKLRTAIQPSGMSLPILAIIPPE